MKCPVCKNKCYESQNECPWCGFPDVNRVFVNNEDAEDWKKTVIEPCQMVWQKTMEQWKSQTSQLNEKLDKYKKQVEELTISKAAMKIINNASDAQKSCTGEFFVGNQHWICDRYRIIKFNNTYETFDCGYSFEVEQKKKVTSYLESWKKQIFENIQYLSIPSIELLKMISEDEENFDFGEDAPLVNVLYLVDMLEALPDAVLGFEKGNMISPIYFDSCVGEGILLPINKSK